MFLKDRRDLHMFKLIEGVSREGGGKGCSPWGSKRPWDPKHRWRVSLREDSQRFHLNRMEGRKGVCGFRSTCGTGGITGSPIHSTQE